MNWKSWKDAFFNYIKNSDKYWGGELTRQNRKLLLIKKKITTEYNLKEKEYFDFLLNLASTREHIPEKVYISNIGGSGSHWLSMMIEEILGWFDVGEVYLPSEFYNEIISLENKEVGRHFYDAVEMLHGFIYNLEVKYVPKANLINSAHSIEKINFHKYLYPNFKVIHLVRDPRDRTLSITYRKDEWRKEAHPEMNDRDYLIYNANRARSHFLKYDSNKIKPDLDIKYEDLKNNGVEILRRIIKLLNKNVPVKHIESVYNKFSASNLRKAKEERLKGNLDEGGVSKPWDISAKEVDLRVMHTILKPAINGFKYNIGDCFGNHFKYDENIRLNRKLRTLLLKYQDNFQLYIENHWEPITKDIIDTKTHLQALKLNVYEMAPEEIHKLIIKTPITVLCISNIERELLIKIFNKIKELKIPYVDASQVKGLDKEIIQKFSNLKAINLSGSTNLKEIELKAKVFIDY